MKRVFTVVLALVGLNATALNRVMKYHDCSSANITTSAWTTCATSTKNANGVGVLNNGASDLIVCLTESSTDCDTTNQIGLKQGFGFTFDKFPASTNIFLKAQSSDCTSGIVSCQIWMEKQ